MVPTGGKNQEVQQISSRRTINGRVGPTICPYIIIKDFLPFNQMYRAEQHLLLGLALTFGLTETFQPLTIFFFTLFLVLQDQIQACNSSTKEVVLSITSLSSGWVKMPRLFL